MKSFFAVHSASSWALWLSFMEERVDQSAVQPITNPANAMTVPIDSLHLDVGMGFCFAQVSDLCRLEVKDSEMV